MAAPVQGRWVSGVRGGYGLIATSVVAGVGPGPQAHVAGSKGLLFLIDRTIRVVVEPRRIDRPIEHTRPGSPVGSAEWRWS